MRLMVIGLDGATYRTLEPWMRAGLMPALKGLIERGARAVMRSTVPPVTAPAWVSCFTGVNPGEHGIYNFVRPGPAWGQSTPNSGSDVRVPRLWQRLGTLGFVTHVLDVPMTSPPEPVTGVMVSDLMVAGEKQARTWPPHLREELKAALGASFEWAIADGLAVSEDYLRHLARSIDEKSELDLYLLRRYPADAVFTVFQHTDVLAHYFWHVWDSTHPAYDAAVSRRLEPLLHAVLRRLDRAVERLLAVAGEEALVAIVSDHGFGPVSTRVHVNDLLLKWGDLKLEPAGRAKLELSRRGLTASGLVNLVRRLDRFGLRRFLRLKDARQAVAMIEALGLVPTLEKSRAWFAHSLAPGITLSPSIRANDAYVDDLVQRLREARPAPDRPRYFERVDLREQVYRGGALEDAPEIVLQLAEGYVATTEISGGPGFSAPNPGQISGFHRPEGVLVLAGPGVRQGVMLPETSILDVTPTLLAGLGLQVPAALEGRCLVEAFEEGLIEVTPAGEGDLGAFRSGAPGQKVFDAAEEQEILRRLRALGYN